MLEAGLLHGAGAKNLAELVQTNLFTNVKLDQDQHRTVKRRLDGRPGLAVALGEGKVLSESNAINACKPAGIKVGWMAPAADTSIVPESDRIGERREGKYASY